MEQSNIKYQNGVIIKKNIEKNKEIYASMLKSETDISPEDKKQFIIPYLELSFNSYYTPDHNAGGSKLYDTKIAELPIVMPMFGAGAGLFIGDNFGLSLNAYGAPFFSNGTGRFGVIDFSSELVFGNEVFGKYGDKNKLRLVLGGVYYDGIISVDESALVLKNIMSSSSSGLNPLINDNSIVVTENHGAATVAQDSGSVTRNYISGYNTSGVQGPGADSFGYSGYMRSDFSSHASANGATGSTWWDTPGTNDIETLVSNGSSGTPLSAIGTIIGSTNAFDSYSNISYSNYYYRYNTYKEYNSYTSPYQYGHYDVSQSWTNQISTQTVTQNLGPQYQQYLDQHYTIAYTHNGITQTSTTAVQSFSSPHVFSIITGGTIDSQGNTLGSGVAISSNANLGLNGDFANNTNANYNAITAPTAISSAQNVLLFAATNHWTSNEFTSAFANTNSGVFGITTDADWNAAWHNSPTSMPYSISQFDYTNGTTNVITTNITPTYYNGGHLASDILSNNGNTHNLTYEHEAYVNYQGNAYLIGVQESYAVTSDYGSILSGFQGQIAQYDAAHQAILDQMAMLAQSQYKIRTGGIKFGAGHTYIINKYCGMKFDINDTLLLSHSGIVEIIGASAGFQVYF